MCSSCVWAQGTFVLGGAGSAGQHGPCCMKCVVPLESQQPQAVFQVSVFCVWYLQLLDKLLVSLKAGCECQFCTALRYFNVYPVNRAGTKITQITGTLLKWLWLLTQKCIYNEMLGILWTARWYFWIYWKQTNLCLITGIMMDYDLNLWRSQGCKQEHTWQNAKKTVLYEKGNGHGCSTSMFLSSRVESTFACFLNGTYEDNFCYNTIAILNFFCVQSSEKCFSLRVTIS